MRQTDSHSESSALVSRRSRWRRVLQARPRPRAPPGPSAEPSRDPTGSRWRRSRSSCATTSPDSRPRRATGKDGTFQFFNIPFNPYELHVEVQGFSPVHQNVDVRTSIPQEIVITLELPAVTESVQVMAEPTAAQLETDNIDVAHRHRQVLHPAGRRPPSPPAPWRRSSPRRPVSPRTRTAGTTSRERTARASTSSTGRRSRTRPA